MSCKSFCVVSKASTPEEAFAEAVKDAKLLEGEEYTGTIAEKHAFELIETENTNPYDFVMRLRGDADYLGYNPFHHKYGPAGCVKISEGKFLFFGLASC